MNVFVGIFVALFTFTSAIVSASASGDAPKPPLIFVWGEKVTSRGIDGGDHTSKLRCESICPGNHCAISGTFSLPHPKAHVIETRTSAQSYMVTFMTSAEKAEAATKITCQALCTNPDFVGTKTESGVVRGCGPSLQ